MDGHARLDGAHLFDIVKAFPSVDVFADAAELDAYLRRMQRRSPP